ncbi:3796_t:CDS:2, partial [Funneliformis mosseae]
MFSLRRVSTQIINKRTLSGIRPILCLRGYATAQDISSLLLVDHKNKAIASSTLNAFTAASKLGVSEVSKIKGVSKVLVAKDKVYEHGIAEVYAPLLASTQKQLKFTHLIAPHSAFGKNIMPRTLLVSNRRMLQFF